LTVVYDGDLQIFYLSQPLKATEQRCRHVVQGISLKLKSNVLSLERNYLIQDVVDVIFDRRLLCATNPSANNAK
jgi:hypothetical protein